MSILAAVAAFIGVLLLIIGVFQARGRSRTGARLDALEAYGLPSSETGVVPLALRRRESAWRERTQGDLERAGLSLKIREYIILRVAIALLLAAAGLLIVGGGLGLLVGLVLGTVGYMLPSFYVRMRIKREAGKFANQLEEMLVMVSGSLRSGFGLLQALDLASEQLQPPMSLELKRLIRDTRMGSTLEEALQKMTDRIDNYDLDMIVTAILIQRSVGSNLSEVLDKVAHTIRERTRIKGEINTLTSQKKLSGWVVGLLPVGVAGVMFAMSPDYMSVLFTTTTGILLLILAFVLTLIGIYIIKRIVSLEV